MGYPCGPRDEERQQLGAFRERLYPFVPGAAETITESASGFSHNSGYGFVAIGSFSCCGGGRCGIITSRRTRHQRCRTPERTLRRCAPQNLTHQTEIKDFEQGRKRMQRRQRAVDRCGSGQGGYSIENTAETEKAEYPARHAFCFACRGGGLCRFSGWDDGLGTRSGNHAGLLLFAG